MIDEPFPHLAQRQAMAHGHRPCPYKAFPSRTQRKPLYRASSGVWAVQHPNRLSMRSSGLQYVQQRRDKRVNTATQILQIDEDVIESLPRGGGRAAHFAIQAEHWNIVRRVHEIRRFHHIVLLITAQAVLGSKRGGDVDVA